MTIGNGKNGVNGKGVKHAGHDASGTSADANAAAAAAMTETAKADRNRASLVPAAERTESKTLEMLVCPVSKTTLEYAPSTQELISRRANLAYPIRSGVPLLTREAARPLDD